jgi:hypothetical protein
MNDLAKKKCKPCEGGVAAYGADEARELLKSLKGFEWEQCPSRHVILDDLRNGYRGCP